MNIAFIGLGGVGGYFGAKAAKFAENNENINVYFIARNKHLEVIQQEGITVKLASGSTLLAKPALATDSIADLPELDVCFVTVKSYDLHSVLTELKGKIHENTKVIPLLNGIDIYERTRNVLTDAVVYPACVYIASYIEEPGVIKQITPGCRIIIGPDPNHPSNVPTELLDVFEKMGESLVYTDNVLYQIWNKFLFISPYGLVTASNNRSIFEVYQDETLRNDVFGIMSEVRQIANKKGIPLTKEDVYRNVHRGQNFPANSTSSFHKDYLRTDKQNEKESLGQVIINLGKQYDVPTPVTERVYASLR